MKTANITSITLPDLPAQLSELLAQIPTGRATTYGDLAETLGSRAAARWVGEYLLDHPHNDGCCCHRVVRSTGEMGLFIGGTSEQKARRLAGDGVSVSNGRVDLAIYRFVDFHSSRPLDALAQFQEQILERVRLQPVATIPTFVGGIDVSFCGANEAVAAYVLLETSGGKVAWSETLSRNVLFPYIPGFLAFRESPLLVALLDIAREKGKLADVVLVDGNGILHPRGAGIATQVGVLANVATIGIGKKLLCGTVDTRGMRAGVARDVRIGERVVGIAATGRTSTNPIYVSPGHLVDMASAARIVQELYFGHRLPEPIYQADALSRRTARTGATS